MRADSTKLQPGATDSVNERVWGLGAPELHDAWWRGRGVQCVHLNTDFDPVAGAELYLLLQANQMVTFELALIAFVVVGSVMAVYCLAADRARRIFASPRAVRLLNRSAGTMIAGAAVAVATR